MTPTAKSPYAGYRFPGEVISHAVWLYFRFPLSLRMVDMSTSNAWAAFAACQSPIEMSLALPVRARPRTIESSD